MAVEAVRQLFGGSGKLFGVHIQDVAFSHAISLPPGTDTIETQLTLTQPSQSTGVKVWSQFRLFARQNGIYTERASGSIRVVFNENDRNRVALTGPWLPTGTLAAWITQIEKACCHGHVRDYYNKPAGEVQWGPAFRNLEDMRMGTGGEVLARINTESWKRNNHGSLEPSFAIHPATLDGLAQPLLQTLLAQRPGDMPTTVPVHIDDIWIDCTTEHLHHGSINVAAKCQFDGYRGGHADVVATAATDRNTPVVYMQGLKTTSIESSEPTSRQAGQSGENPHTLCTKLVWKPDISTMTHEQLVVYCTRQRPKQRANAVEDLRSLMIALLCFIEETLSFMEHHSLPLMPHLEAYVGWMRYQQHQLRTGQSPVSIAMVHDFLNKPEARETLNRQLEETSEDGFFFIPIGRRVIQMLRGEIDPLDFIFRDGLADRYYEKMLANEHHAYPASELLDLVSFKNPSMRILEVGAGTGGQTMHLLETMSRDGVCKWEKYDYTDLSPGFFSNAREKFSHYGNMDFRVCDISKDPIAQKFEAASYDLVVASHVLHATDSLRDTLRNVRKLLKPDGKLLLFETTVPNAIPVGFAFGLLKGWWSPLDHESRTPYSPCVTVAQWDKILRETGFSGVDVDIPGQEEPFCQYSSILISSAVPQINNGDTKEMPLQQIHLIVNDKIESQCCMSESIRPLVSTKTAGISCKTSTLAEVAREDIISETCLVIFLIEVDAAFLDSISEVDYDNLKLVLLRARQTLWVTRAEISKGTDPSHHLAIGLGRALMSEESTRKFVTLSLDEVERDSDMVGNLICDLAQRIVLSPTAEAVENDYVVSDGVLQVCRVSENVAMDKTIARAKLPLYMEERDLTADTRVALRCSPGHLDTFEWFENEEGDKARGSESGAEEDLQADEVFVCVRAIGLTLRDSLIARGHLNGPNLGTECAGVVQKSGSNTDIKVGDRVCLISTSTARSTVRVKAAAVSTIPPQMSFAEAASIPSCLWISYHAVVNLARLQRDEVVLILQGASCVGQIAIQLVRNRGARALVVTSSSAKAKFLSDEFQFPEGDMFYYDDPALLSKIYQSTRGKGVDVILGALCNTDNGDARHSDLSSCLQPFGRLVDTSLSMPGHSSPDRHISDILLNTSRSSLNMVDLLQKKPDLAHRIFQEAMKCAFGEHLSPPKPLIRFSAGDAMEALSSLSDHTVPVGKRVIEMHDNMTIKVSL